MFDHLGIVVGNLDAARDFYAPALKILGVELLQDNTLPNGEGWLVFADAGNYPFFVIAAGKPSYWGDEHSASQSPAHIAFRATSRAAVDAFHAHCMSQGGKDNGPPGERSPGAGGGSYYAAYVIDPDGNNIEAGVRNA